MTGVLTVDARLHFQKRFDLVERALPDAPGVVAVSTEAFQRWHLERSLHAMGAATEADLRGYLTYPRIGAAARRPTLRAMLDSGEMTEIEVERSRERWFVLTRDLGMLARTSRRRQAAHGTTLLSPFDSFLWYRERIARLFGFEYRIEVYTPGHKRVHGYYSLPIIHQGHLIGRLDAKAHRRERRLEVRSVHFEPWVSAGEPPPAIGGGPLDTDPMLAGLAAAARSLATFLGADRITIGRVAPHRMRSPLVRALRDAGEHVPRDRSGSAL
jgi:uncharacterized protein YcaQ